MKLLSKNEVQGLQTKERGVEIGEGLKLARKIDVLRETAAKEESNLAKFRMETLRIIRGEIDGQIRVKTALIQEIAELENTKKGLIIAIESSKEIINNI